MGGGYGLVGQAKTLISSGGHWNISEGETTQSDSHFNKSSLALGKNQNEARVKMRRSIGRIISTADHNNLTMGDILFS